MKPFLQILRLPLDFICLTIDWIRCLPELFFRFTAKHQSCPFCIIGQVDTSKKTRTCDAAKKYGNVWLFRSVCSCARAADAEHDAPWCGRRDPYKRKLIHLPFTALLLLAAWLGIAIAGAELAGRSVMDNLARVVNGEAFFVKAEAAAEERAPLPSTASKESRSVQERAAQALAKAKAFYAAGDYANARISFLNARQADPEDPEARYWIGRCQMQLGEMANALSSLKAALARDPDHLEAHTALAEIYLFELNYAEAEKHASIVRKARPDDLGITLTLLKAFEGLRRYDAATAEAARLASSTNLVDQVELAEYHMRRGNPETAIPLYEQILRANSTNQPAHYGLAEALIREADFAGAEKIIASARSISSNALEVVVLDAKMLFARGETKPALDAYRGLVKKYPNADFIKIRLADLLSRAGPLDECRQLVESLEHSRDPKIAAQAQQMLARLFLGRGMLPEAQAYSDKVLRADPVNLEVLLIKAQVDAKRGKLPEAMKLVDRALTIQPDHLSALGLKALGLQASKDIEGAAAIYQRLADLQPENPMPLGGLASLQFNQGDFSACVESCTEALKRNALAPIAANRRALAYVERGEVDKAYASIAPIYAQLPDNAYVADAYGWVLLQQGKTDSALELLEKVGKRLRGPLVFYHLGAAYAQAGKMDAARPYLQQALQYADAFPGADKARALLAGLGDTEPQP